MAAQRYHEIRDPIHSFVKLDSNERAAQIPHQCRVVYLSLNGGGGLQEAGMSEV